MSTCGTLLLDTYDFLNSINVKQWTVNFSNDKSKLLRSLRNVNVTHGLQDCQLVHSRAGGVVLSGTVMAQKKTNLRTTTSPEDKMQMSSHSAIINQY